MSAPRRCHDCTHTVGQHWHLVPHPCKADGCNCGSYAREPIIAGAASPEPQEGTK